MKTVLFNYSKLMSRDAKLYSIGGKNIAGGVSIKFLQVILPIISLFLLLGWFISLPFGINMLNALENNWNYYYLISWGVTGIVVAMGMWSIRIGGYRLYQYLNAYIKKKKVYKNSPNLRDREYVQYKMKVDALFKSVL